MERCPVCQARFRQEPVCLRCRADLSKLLAIEAEADVWLRQAFTDLAAGREAQAKHAVEASLRLKHGLLASRLRLFLVQRLA